MAVRFQTDADLSQIIVAAVLRRSADIDFQTAHAASPQSLAVPAAAEDLALIWAATTPEEWANRIL